MAVYVIPRNRNNIWWGGGRGGGGGILDLLSQALIQPMLQRDALARQYKYDARLADQKHNLDLQLEQARWGRQDDLINQHDLFVRENPNAIPGTGGATATFLALGGKGDLAQYQPYLLPQSQSIDLGGQVHTRGWNPNGTVVEGATYDKTLSPNEAGTLALATRKTALEEEMARAENARKDRLANYTIYGGGGGGKASDPYAGINAAANLFEAISKFNPGGGGGGSLNIPGMEGLGAGAQQPPIDMSETLSLANRLVTEELNRRYGLAPGNGLTFEDMLALNGGVFGGSPMLSDFNNGLPPEAGMEDTATITPQPAAAQPQGAGAPSFRERLRDWRTGDAPVAVPGTPQASAKKPFVSAAAVANYAKQFGISEEAARDELTRFNSM